MIKWIKRILALIFALSVSTFLIVGLCIITIVSKGHNTIKTERWKLNNNHRIGFVGDSTMMYRAKPNAHYRWSELTNNPIDTNKIITIDSLQRRITPHSEVKNQHALFFGCSYIYGDGLSDEYTIPYLFGEKDSIYNPYNYALSGYGTAQMLELLKRDLKSEIIEEKGIGLYFLVDHHKDRISNDPYTMIWGYDFPRYVLDKDLNLQREGSFSEKESFAARFWKGFGEYNLWKPILVIQKIRRKKKAENSEKEELISANSANNWEIKLTNGIELNGVHDHKYLLMSKIIKASEELYLKQFPKGQFYVVIFPGEITDALPFLEFTNLKVIDLSKSLDLEAINGRQADGYHPNVIGTEAIAGLLQERLDSLNPIY